MENPADYIFGDRIPLAERIKALSFIFKDILSPKGFLPFKAIKGDVLDLGCGQGAVGEILKSKNSQINLIGVDIRDYPDRNPETYPQFLKTRALDFLKQAQESNQRFDLIISVGMPPEEVEKIIKNIDPEEILKPGGHMVLIVDSPLEISNQGKFQIKESEWPIAKNIAFYSRPEGK